MEIYKLSPLLLLLLLGACSKPAEKEDAAEPSVADTVESQVDQAADVVEPPVNSVVEAPGQEAELVEETSVNYDAVLLKTLEDADQILELEQNMQALRLLEEATVKYQASIAAETDEAVKVELQNSIDTAEAEYAELNAKMLEVYGMDYASSNEYMLVPTKAQLFVQLSEEEIAEESAKGAALEEEQNVFAMTKELQGSELIEQFKRDLNIVTNLQLEISQMRKALPDVTEEDVKAELEEYIQDALAVFQENDEKMFETYGYTAKRPTKIKYVELDIYSQPILPDLNQVPSVPGDYVLVSTLEGPEVNAEFVQNVEIMGALRARLYELNQQIESETDEAIKAGLQEEFDQLSDQMDENNQAMAELYQYSLNRNYLQVVNKARVLVQISEEEIAKQIVSDPEFKVSEEGFAELLVIEGVELNREFRNNVQLIQMLKEQIMRAKVALQEEADADKKAELESQIDNAMDELLKGNQKMTELYGYSLSRNYEYSVEISQVFLQLTRQEIVDLLSKEQ